MDEKENIDYEFTASTSQVSKQISGLISTLTGLRKMVNNVGSALRSAAVGNTTYAKTAKVLAKETSAISKGLTSSITSLTGMRKSVNSVGSDIKSTNAYIKALKSSTTALAPAMKSGAAGIDNMGEEAEDAEHGLDKLDRKSITLAATIGSTLSRAFDRAFQSISNMLRGAVANSIDYIEVTNLLTVALGDQADEAERYADTIEETFGSDSSEIKRSIGTLNQLTKTMGTTASQAEWMSQNFVNAGLDLSSLWNVSLAQTLEAIESSLSGLPKSMRTLFGIDTSATALEALALAHGLDVTYSNLNRANKAALVYIAIMRGASSANGDLAKTIETPANQLKILTQQVVIFGRTFADFFLGVISGALPYLNAILMTLTAIMRTFAGLMGIAEGDFVGAFSGASSSVDDLEDGIEDAEDAAKSFLLPFDELNVLNPDDGSADADFGSGGGIDPELLKIMEQYENTLEDVTMKATELRDRWMELLGFTKLVNEETEEVSWQFEGLTGTSAAVLGVVGSLVGLLVGSKVVKVVSGIAGAFKLIKPAVTPATAAVSGLGGAAATTAGGITFLGLTGVAAFLAIAAIAAAVVFAIINQWENLVKIFNQIFQGIVQIVSGKIAIIGGILSIFWGILTGDIELMKEGFRSVINGFATMIAGVFNMIQGIVHGVASIVIGIINAIIAAINIFIKGINGAISLSNKFAKTKFSTIGEIGYVQYSANVTPVTIQDFGFAARGGTLQGGQPFVAGEHGKMEAIGDYKGKTTVMPLENTSFTQAIGRAVFEAVLSAMGNKDSGDQEINVYIGNEKLDSFIYKSYNTTSRNRGTQIFGGALNEQFL